MVLGVCRHLLGDVHDAEAAFQATFLVLARKAGSLRDPERLAPWLYGVARRISLRAKGRRDRRRLAETQHEPAEHDEPGTEPGEDQRRLEQHEQAEAIHEEIGRLPDAYRAVVVLCYLEGLSHESAARRLGWPVGSVSVRLMRARERLRSRLVRRGVTLSAQAIAALSVSVAVPRALADATAKSATLVSAGGATAVAASTTAVALASETFGLRLWTTAQLAAIVLCLALGALGAWAAGANRRAVRPAAARPGGTPALDRPARASSFQTVDLQPWGNLALDDGFVDAVPGPPVGNDLASLPRGVPTFDGTPFAIGRRMIRLHGRRAPTATNQVRGIRVGAAFDRIHVLHAVHGWVRTGDEVAAYVLRYADGTSERIPIVYGRETATWWTEPTYGDPTAARVVWTGQNRVASWFGRTIRLFAMSWSNPHPDRKVAALDFESVRSFGEPFLVAISLESRPPDHLGQAR
jgi:RNA polymerase sigma factor (sigma-70 family)